MESEVLNELELRALRVRKEKNLDETAKILGKTIEETLEIIKSAERKLSSASSMNTEAVPMLERPKFFGLDRRIGQPQTGIMKVGSQIIEILGKGVYSVPWNALKELISNSFDACATCVDIKYVSEEKKLVLKDDGFGMDYVNFDDHFTFISQSDKRQKGDICEICGRPLIGKFGIGFIAVSQLCDEIRVTSAKKGSDTYFVAEIDFGKLRRLENQAKEFYQVSQFTLTNFDKKDLNEHYTKIELLKLNKAFVDVLNNVIPGKEWPSVFKPKTFEDVIQRLCSGEITNIRMEVGPFWEFITSLANVIPVEYSSDGPMSFPDNIVIEEKHRQSYDAAIKLINDLKLELSKLNFKVFFNGLQLKKPARFPNENWLQDYDKQLRIFHTAKTIDVVDPSTEKASKISYRGYFYYQKTRIVPEELRGMIIRVKNVAIGGPSRDLWGYPYPGDKIYLDQIYGEIYVDSGLEDAMNIDRSTFKTTHFEYTALQNSLHKFLRAVVFTTAKNMWYTRRASKEKDLHDQRLETRTNAVSAMLGEGFLVEETRQFLNKAPVQIKSEEKRLYINERSPVFWNFRKQERILLEDVAIALEIAMREERDPEKIKEAFWRSLKRLLTG